MGSFEGGGVDGGYRDSDTGGVDTVGGRRGGRRGCCGGCFGSGWCRWRLDAVLEQDGTGVDVDGAPGGDGLGAERERGEEHFYGVYYDSTLLLILRRTTLVPMVHCWLIRFGWLVTWLVGWVFCPLICRLSYWYLLVD